MMNSERSRVSCLYGPKHMDPWVKRMKVSSILPYSDWRGLNFIHHFRKRETQAQRGKGHPGGHVWRYRRSL